MNAGHVCLSFITCISVIHRGPAIEFPALLLRVAMLFAKCAEVGVSVEGLGRVCLLASSFSRL